MKYIRKFNESEQESTYNISYSDIREMEDLTYSMGDFLDGLDNNYFKNDDKFKSILSDVSGFVSQFKSINDKIDEYLDDVDNLTDEAIEELGIDKNYVKKLKTNKEDQ